MILTRTVAPAVEPLSTAEAKNHLRVDTADDDILIDALIKAARERVEDLSHRALITQTWRYSLDAWPEGDVILLPRPPLVSVSQIQYLDTAGSPTTWASSNYIVDTDSEPGRVVLAYGISWPTETLYPSAPIQITYDAGYGAAGSNVPQHLRQAILLLVGHWYENREATVGGAIIREVPLAVESLILQDRAYGAYL